MSRQNHYPWAEVDNPVELHNQARFAFLETKLTILKARTGSQQGPGEFAGPPHTNFTLQIAAVLVLCRLLWRRKGSIVTYKKTIGLSMLHATICLDSWTPTSTVIKQPLVCLVFVIVLFQELLHGPGVGQVCLKVFRTEGHLRFLWTGSVRETWIGRTQGFLVTQTNTAVAFSYVLSLPSSKGSPSLPHTPPGLCCRCAPQAFLPLHLGWSTASKFSPAASGWLCLFSISTFWGRSDASQLGSCTTPPPSKPPNISFSTILSSVDQRGTKRHDVFTIVQTASEMMAVLLIRGPNDGVKKSAQQSNLQTTLQFSTLVKWS